MLRLPVPAILFVAASFAQCLAAEAADISSLLKEAATAAESGDQAATIDALEEALAQVRREAPLVAEPFLLVTHPAQFFGDYAPRADAVFRGGEAQQFYLEPRNLVYPRSDAGLYEPAFDVDLQILTAAEQVVVDQESFGSFRLATQSPVQDIFLNLKVALSGAPPGEYQIRFVIRDRNSEKTAAVTQLITLQ